jgi:hypothetical protein
MNSRERWVRDTREATGRALAHEYVPLSARALVGNLDIDTWTFGGPLTRTEREIGAALRWLVSQGYAERVPEEERWSEYDPPGVLFIVTPTGMEKFQHEVNH